MKIALIQSTLVWENKDENLLYFNKVLNDIDKDTDLVILPEMFTTGFTMTPKECVKIQDTDQILEWMITWCKKSSFSLCGSVAIKIDETFCNRLFFVYPDGTFKTYDKKHLFSLAGEDKIYKSGNDRLILNYKGFNICPLICYDLRFPVFSRNNQTKNVDGNSPPSYDILIYVANWPKPRINAWDALLKARAIENMAFVVGVNRLGQDQNNHTYTGHSQLLDCMGQYIIEPQVNEGVYYATIKKEDLYLMRTKLPFLNDADDFNII